MSLVGSMTGRKPADTYKGLIKVDGNPNTALDSTLRTLCDGIGTDSALSLSTTTVRASKLEVDDIVIDSNSISNSTLDGGTF